MQLLLATQNPGKKQEIVQLLEGLSIEVLTLDDIATDTFEFPEETGTTFRQNAQIKAQTVALFSNIPTLADDSGLSVVALDDFPGVISARWMEGSDQDRSAGILKKLSDTDDRSAKFICSLCFFSPENNEAVFFDGIQSGTIAETPAGDQGFGYDPIFVPEGQSKTYAELGAEYKNQHSHRALALAKFRQFLEQSMLD